MELADDGGNWPAAWCYVPVQSYSCSLRVFYRTLVVGPYTPTFNDNNKIISVLKVEVIESPTAKIRIFFHSDSPTYFIKLLMHHSQ